MRWVVAPDPGRALLFDGREGGPAEVAFACAGCGRPVSEDLWTLVGRGRASWAWTAAEREAFGLQRVKVLDWEIGRTEGLEAHLVEVSCPCGALHVVVLGLSEVQPARYQARLHGVAVASARPALPPPAGR